MYSLQSIMRQKKLRGLQSADFNRESLPGQLRDRGLAADWCSVSTLSTHSALHSPESGLNPFGPFCMDWLLLGLADYLLWIIDFFVYPCCIRHSGVAILVYNRIRYDAPTRIKYIQTFVQQI